MRKYSKMSLAALAVSALAAGLLASGGGVAQADAAPTAGDVVGIGSDTVQYLIDFGADGDASADLGYNSGGNLNRLVNFDATPDANARAAYAEGSTSNSPISLNPTIVLRSGTKPVYRPNGSGDGINALLADGTQQEISFARMSRPPKASEQTSAAGASGVGTLRVVQLATDTLAMASATTTNAPTLSVAQLKAIYTCQITTWHQLNSAIASTDTIIPIIPQTGSGTRSTFETDIGVSDSTIVTDTLPNAGGCVRVGEENDPYSLYINANGDSVSTANPDAIAPMSGGRLNLYLGGPNNASYFNNPANKYPSAQTPLTPTVKITTTGTGSDGGAAYDDVRGLFVTLRQSDALSTVAWQAGGSKNWANTLFTTTSGQGTPYFNTTAGKALLKAAGVTPAYVDEGPGYSVG